MDLYKYPPRPLWQFYVSMKNNPSLGIYIHIPFCKSKCHYCDFCSSPSGDETKNKYVNALINQITDMQACEHFSDRTVDTVYFGGGTPTCLPPDTLNDILHAVFESYSVSNETEITTECNPGTTSTDDLTSLRRGGFNRLSIGMQSANDQELQSLGRVHDMCDLDKTFNGARKAGFDNISLDLMYGIPRQTLSSFDHTLNTVIDYSPEHISAYSLKIEPGTFFFKNKENLILPDEDCEYDMYDHAVSLLESAGYSHYEISNYAKNGYRSKHNVKYWNCDDYIGFGIAAHSRVGARRYSVTTSLEEYIACNGKLKSDHISLEGSLTNDEFAEEYIMMRMRLSDGISLQVYEERFGKDFEKKYFERLVPYIKSGHIMYNSDLRTLCFSKEGMYVSNYILSNILDLGQ